MREVVGTRLLRVPYAASPKGKAGLNLLNQESAMYLVRIHTKNRWGRKTVHYFKTGKKIG